MAENGEGQHDSHVYAFRSHVEQQVEKAQEARKQFFIDSVWYEHMTPTQAEEAGAAETIGYLDLILPTTMESPRWSLAQAVLWVAWRDPHHVQEQWRRLHAWSGSLWRDPPGEHQVETFEQAEAHLWAALEASRVHATGLPGHESRPAKIEPLDWSNLVWMPDKTRLSVRWFGQPGPAYRVVEVRGADMLAVWPPLGEQPQVPTTSALIMRTQIQEQATAIKPKKRGGGRPTIHHWAGAAAFVGWYIGENDYPDVEEVLVDEVERWFGDDGPGRREIQSFVSDVYKQRSISRGV